MGAIGSRDAGTQRNIATREVLRGWHISWRHPGHHRNSGRDRLEPLGRDNHRFDRPHRFRGFCAGKVVLTASFGPP
jgi:hypothetical protein